MNNTPTDGKLIANWLWPYVRYSTDWYYMMRGKRQAKINEMERLVADGKRSLEHVGDLIGQWNREIATLDAKHAAGEYVSPLKCNKVGVLIDWKQYYADRDERLNDSIDQQLWLADATNNPEYRRAILNRVIKLQNKIDGVKS